MKPNIIYKFLPYNVNSLSLLVNQSLWLADPSSLNDPFDVAVRFSGMDVVERVSKIYLEENGEKSLDGEVEERLKSMRFFIDALDEQLKQSGIVSYTTNIDSLLMWSHYGDGHKGFCLEFETGDSNVSLHPVQYKPQPDQINVLDVVNGKINLRDSLHSLIFTKPLEWAYENEWRTFSFFRDSPTSQDRMTRFPGTLKSVTFGSRMDPVQIQTVWNILFNDFQDIECYVMKVLPNEYRLSREKISRR